MSDPLDFPSKSPRYELPLLFAGQAQKEFFVNEAHILIDALLHPVVQGERDAPPEDPAQGECWLIGSNPASEWSTHAGQIAAWQGGTWLFVTPRDGMRILDRSKMQDMFFRGGWQYASAPDVMEDGEVVDQAARRAIEQLTSALIAGGILSPKESS